MANWNLNYGVNFKGGGSPKIKCNTTLKGGNGLQIVMGGDIPDGDGFGAEDTADLAVDVVSHADLDGLDASDPANHVKCLKTIAAFCEKLASKLEG
jgi:hypothetical protein